MTITNSIEMIGVGGRVHTRESDDSVQMGSTIFMQFAANQSPLNRVQANNTFERNFLSNITLRKGSKEMTGREPEEWHRQETSEDKMTMTE